MSKQYNKEIKRRRRTSYLKRRKTRDKQAKPSSPTAATAPASS